MLVGWRLQKLASFATYCIISERQTLSRKGNTKLADCIWADTMPVQNLSLA